MEQLPTPALTPVTVAAESAPVTMDAACPACGPVSAPRKLDLTGMAAPGDLRAARLEEFTIDGICGVY